MKTRFLQGLGPVPPVLGLAVSGGGDSMAMLALAVEAGLTCHAVTVDHGLRDGSAAEAEGVARTCAAMGVLHATLRWHWDGKGNLMDAARRARRDLIAEWAQGQGIGTVALGHTRDDVAETFLMRLARGAGLDGLAAMNAVWVDGIEWRRPLLAVGRQDLRDLLIARGIDWVEDPSNDNPRFDRVRARKAMSSLPLGLTADRLADVAHHLADARLALEEATLTALRSHTSIQGGDVLIVDGLGPEILRRVILQALAWVGSAEYGPRGTALIRAMQLLREGRPAALQGCRMVRNPQGIRIFREAQALRGLSVPAGQLWDRWHVTGPENNGLRIAMLGATGLAECKGWRETGLPRASLVASPAVWDGQRLVAAPLAGFANGWAATHVPGPAAFHSSPLSH